MPLLIDATVVEIWTSPGGDGGSETIFCESTKGVQGKGRVPVTMLPNYQGGYPPEGRGCCTDVIWRAFKGVGYIPHIM